VVEIRMWSVVVALTRMWSVYYCGGPGVACHVYYLYCGDPGVWLSRVSCFEHHGGDSSGGVSGYTWYGDDPPELSEPGQ